MALVASPAFAQFSLSDAANVVSAMQGNQGEQGEGVVAAAPKAAGLLNTLGSELKITPEQAIGGAGAMLGLAKNRLSEPQFFRVEQQCAGPGSDCWEQRHRWAQWPGRFARRRVGQKNALLDGLLGNVKDTGDLNNAFSALGMDSGMIGQFAPIILQYLGQQGVAGSLLQNLGGIWGAGAGV
nr:DUF2780 domain-containing protein [Pseudomonas brassicacearum subsp. brassicacearum]